MNGAILKGCGGTAVIGGIIGAVVSLKMNTSVHLDSDYRYGSFIPASDTINIGLLQDQHLAFLASGLVFIAGIILFSAGAIIAAMGVGRVGAVHPATVTDGAIDPGPGAVEPSARPVSLADAKKDETALIVLGSVAALVLLVLAVFAVSGANSADRSIAAAQIAANADTVADNMEMQADNMDALADTTSVPAEVAPTPAATAEPEPAGTSMDEPALDDQGVDGNEIDS